MTLPPATAIAPRGAAAIAAGSVTAAEAGARLLEAGGSAVDAVIASALAACVAEPGLTSLGGGGFLMVRDPQGATTLIDFFVAVPGSGAAPASRRLDDVLVRYSGAEQVFRIGPGSVAVPGALDGLTAAHRRWGRRPMAEVVEPALRAASDGVAIEPAQAHVLDLIGDVMAHTEGSRRLFTDAGRPLKAGERIALPGLAALLERVGEGEIGTFAHPDLADALVELCSAFGPFTADDLESYRVIDRDPLSARLGGSAGGINVLTNPAPSFGGSIVVEALHSLFDRSDGTSGLPLAVLEATAAVKSRRDPGRDAVRGTTHASAIDADGWIAAMTTSNGSCSGVVLPGFDMQLNNMMGETDLLAPGADHDVPGQRLRSMMAPTIVERTDGAVAGLGSGGSERIRSAMTNVLLRLSMGESLSDAIAAPRMHADDSGTLHIEPGHESSVVLDAERRLGEHANGAVLNHWSQHDFFFGGVNGVMRHADGSVEAVADARRGGAAIAVPS